MSTTDTPGIADEFDPLATYETAEDSTRYLSRPHITFAASSSAPPKLSVIESFWPFEVFRMRSGKAFPALNVGPVTDLPRNGKVQFLECEKADDQS